MTQSGRRARVSAATNCFINAALEPKGEWLPMMALQFRQSAEDFIKEDRERCACMLDTAGEFEAAKLMRGFRSKVSL